MYILFNEYIIHTKCSFEVVADGWPYLIFMERSFTVDGVLMTFSVCFIISHFLSNHPLSAT